MAKTTGTLAILVGGGPAPGIEIASLSRIHFEGGSVLWTSRANPARSAEKLLVPRCGAAAWFSGPSNS
jgi:6-phosphofructokinase